jgi:hypothetical protein
MTIKKRFNIIQQTHDSMCLYSALGRVLGETPIKVKNTIMTAMCTNLEANITDNFFTKPQFEYMKELIQRKRT